jgi:hypothetical protein
MNAAELLTKTLPRLARYQEGSGVSFVDALNTAVDLFFERLHRRRSEVVQQKFDDLDVEPIFNLPPGFRGLADRPRLKDQQGNEYPLKEWGPEEYVPADGEPRFFRLLGARQMELLPAPTERFTLEGRYSAHPGTLTMSSNLPWGGLFDSALGDAVVAVVAAGNLETAIRSLPATIDSMIDGTLTSRTVSPRRNKLW